MLFLHADPDYAEAQPAFSHQGENGGQDIFLKGKTLKKVKKNS